MATAPLMPVDDRPFTGGDAMLSAVGATLLIGTEMVGAIVAFAWAMGGLLGLGSTVTYGLMAVTGVPALLAAGLFTRRILRVEATLRGEARAAAKAG
jgi:hypothetical protein